MDDDELLCGLWVQWRAKESCDARTLRTNDTWDASFDMFSVHISK